MSTSNSLRAALMVKGIESPVRLPHTFQRCPKSLRELVRILQLPDPELARWRRVDIENFDEGWTNEFQGFAYADKADAGVWFFSNRAELLKVNWLPNQSFRIIKRYRFAELGPEFTEHHHHFGDIDFADGVLFVPVEVYESHALDGRYARLLAFTANLELIGWAELSGKLQSFHTGWFAVDPWNRDVVWTSDDDTTFFYAYDVKRFYEVLDKPAAWPKRFGITLPLRTFNLTGSDGQPYTIAMSLQGVAFSPNGRLYVSLARHQPVGWDNHLLCFDGLTGMFLGSLHVDHPEACTVGEELQGLEYFDGGIYSPYLDNDGLDNKIADLIDDEIDIVKLCHPDPTHPI